MKVTNESILNNINTSNSVSTVKSEEEKAKEIFKTVFLEKMVSEMLKTTQLFTGGNQTQNDFYQEQMAESISDQLMQSSDIRWNQLLSDLDPNLKSTDHTEK